MYGEGDGGEGKVPRASTISDMYTLVDSFFWLLLIADLFRVKVSLS